MKDKNNKSETVVETEDQVSKTDKFLNDAKGKYDEVLLLGIGSNGKFDISSTMNNVAIIQYLLSKASFEVNVMEMQNQSKDNGGS